MNEEPLTGGNVNEVVRVGETVRRPAGDWTPTIHAVLAWVRARGVTQVPVPLGLDDQGRDVVSYLPGETSGHPTPAWVWDPEVLTQAASLLRRWHDATTDFPTAGATWRMPVREPAEVICLGDVAPCPAHHRPLSIGGSGDGTCAAPPAPQPARTVTRPG